MLELPEQITFFMAFLMLCFAGLLVMFYFVLRAVDELAKTMRHERSALVESLRDVEAAMQRLEATMTAPSAPKKQAPSFAPETAPCPQKEERLDFSPENFSAVNPAQTTEPALNLLSMSPEQQKTVGANGKVLRLDGIEPLLLK